MTETVRARGGGMARRVVCREFGDPSGLGVVEEPLPDPGPDEVVVEVDAAGVSFVDGLFVRGGYQIRASLPFTPGSAIAGRVVAVGEGVTDRVAGTAVAGLLPDLGGYASHVRMAASATVPLPAGVDPLIAATAIENYSTMVFALLHRVEVAEGEWVVVLGAGGGIGLAAVDVARSAGARVVAVASSEAKRDAARALGAEVALGYDDLKAEIRRVTGRGADVVVDPVGGAASEQALRALGAGGRFCVLGFAAGEIPRLPSNIVLLRNRSVIGVDWGDWMRTLPDEAVVLLGEVFDRIAAGRLHPPAPRVVGFDDVAQVLEDLGRRAVTGKIALVPARPAERRVRSEPEGHGAASWR